MYDYVRRYAQYRMMTVAQKTLSVSLGLKLEYVGLGGGEGAA